MGAQPNMSVDLKQQQTLHFVKKKKRGQGVRWEAADLATHVHPRAP